MVWTGQVEPCSPSWFTIPTKKPVGSSRFCESLLNDPDLNWRSLLLDVRDSLLVVTTSQHQREFRAGMWNGRSWAVSKVSHL